MCWRSTALLFECLMTREKSVDTILSVRFGTGMNNDKVQCLLDFPVSSLRNEEGQT